MTSQSLTGCLMIKVTIAIYSYHKFYQTHALTLLRNPFSTDAAFTDSDRGILMVFSRITKQ